MAAETVRAGAVESRAASDALLAGLRSGGFRAAAWKRFALDTALRSVSTVSTHRRAAAELTALHAGLAVAGRGKGRKWVAASWLMSVTHLGLLGPRQSIGAASAVTLARANLPALGIGTPWLGVVAIGSDKLDGIMARRAGPTQFGHYADSLADAAFWAWFAQRHETDRRALAVAGLAWLAPVGLVTALSFAKGHMVDAPRPAWVRPAAAMQAVLAARAFAHRRESSDGRPRTFNGLAAFTASLRP